MAQTIPIPGFTIQSGPRVRGPFSSPVAFSEVKITLNFVSFPPDAFLTLLIQISVDGGVTQRDFGSVNIGPGLNGRQGPTNTLQMNPKVSDVIPQGARITLKTNASVDLPVASGTLEVT